MLIAAVLLFAGVAKIHDPVPYLRFVATLGVGKSLAYTSLVVITALELCLAAFTLIGFYPWLVWRLVTLLFLGFVGVVGYAYARGVGGSCGCFGRLLPGRVGLGEIIRDLLLAAGAYFVARSSQTKNSVSPPTSSDADPFSVK